MEECKKRGSFWVPETDWGAVPCQCWKGTGEMAKCKERKESKQWPEFTGDYGQRVGYS